MKVKLSTVLVGLFVVSSCGGGSTTSSTEASGSPAQSQPVQTSPESATSETLPALLDASTDIDAIDMPVVLWFWSPG